MVEEFMLLANITVAEKIQEEFQQCALLRRHPTPPTNNFESMIAIAKSKVFRNSKDDLRLKYAFYIIRVNNYYF